MKTWIKTIAWMILGALMMLGLAGLGNLAHPLPGAAVVFWICLAGGLAVTVVGGVRVFSGMRSAREKVIQRRQRDLEAEARIEENPDAERRQVIRAHRRVWATWAALVLLWAVVGLSYGAGYGLAGIGSAWVITMGMWILAPVIRFGLCLPSLPVEGTELERKDAPRLFALVDEVRAQVGHTRRVCLYMGGENVGVFRNRSCDCLTIDLFFLWMLTYEELRQILLHEFDHLVNPELALETKWRLTVLRFDALADDDMMIWGFLNMAPVVEDFRASMERYCALVSRGIERAADARVRAQGRPDQAASAMAKAALYAKFQQEDAVSSYRILAPETPLPNVSAIRREVYREMAGRLGETWIQEIERELPAHFDSHPTFAQRREALGAPSYDPFSEETDEGWKAEVDALCAREDRAFAQSPRYPDLRRQLYLSRKHCMDAYEQADDPLNTLDTQALLDAADAYEGLDTPRALEIERAVLAREPRNGRARLLYGIHLLRVRDDHAFEQLYLAAENGNYTREALEHLSQRVFETGDPEKIREYETRAGELLQSAEDFHESLDGISLRDLKPCTLPEPLLRQLADEMAALGMGSITAIDCASKTLTEAEDGHVFVLRYDENVDEDRQEEVYGRIFELLDQREESFSLRNDGDPSMDQLEKRLPKSRVYTKG